MLGTNNTEWGKKREWTVVSSRVPRQIADKLKQDYKSKGQVSALIHALLEKYFQGKILGVKLDGY